ncbi:MAG TPA: hypothetical protein VFV50_02295 [Bdellovibrionales bacterium]|nr:hypothetical protein [Bdellovibrionales bacterium]
MSKTRKIFDSLCQAFPLKPIRDDRHLEAAVRALAKVTSYLEKNPNEQDEVLPYLHDLEELIQEYREKHSVH